MYISEVSEAVACACHIDMSTARVRVRGALQSEIMPGLLTSIALPVQQALTAACHYLTQFHQNGDAARAVGPNRNHRVGLRGLEYYRQNRFGMKSAGVKSSAPKRNLS